MPEIPPLLWNTKSFSSKWCMKHREVSGWSVWFYQSLQPRQLLEKLILFGIMETSWKSITCYLQNRSYYVSINFNFDEAWPMRWPEPDWQTFEDVWRINTGFHRALFRVYILYFIFLFILYINKKYHAGLNVYINLHIFDTSIVISDKDNNAV